MLQNKTLFLAILLFALSFCQNLFGQIALPIDTSKRAYWDLGVSCTKGTIHLTTGDSLVGYVYIHYVEDNVYYNQKRKIKQKEVKSIRLDTLGGLYFYPCIIEANGLNIGKGETRYFLDLTPENKQSKILMGYKNEDVIFNKDSPKKLLKGEWQFTFNVNGNFEKTYIFNAGNVTPYHKKLPKMLADCPELAKKIADKQEGYFYKDPPMFSLSMAQATKVSDRLVVLRRILDTYETCKSKK